MISLDATIIHVGLPTIARELRGDMSAMQWIANAYTLMFASGLLGAGALSDRYGARRMFLAALVVFTLASAACGFAQGSLSLSLARALQGLGAASILPSSMALLVHAFADPKRRSRALGVWSAISASAIIAGPVIGGAMVEALGWRSIFLINLPVGFGLIALALYGLGVPPRHDRQLEPLGQLLAASCLIALTFSATEGRALGWGSPWVLTAVAVGLVSGGLFWISQRRSESPVLPRGLSASQPYRLSLLTAFLYNFAYYGALFALSLILQGRGTPPASVGLLFLPMTGATAVAAFSLPRLAARIGARPVIVASLTCGALGAVVLQLAGVGLPGMALGGLLIGVAGGALPVIVSIALAEAPAAATGVAAAALNAARQSGGALSVAALGSILATTGAAGASFSLAALGVAFVLGAVLAGLG